MADDPNRPTKYHPEVLHAESGGLVAQQALANAMLEANREAREAKSLQNPPENIIPLANAGHGQDRPQDTYAELKSVTPQPESEISPQQTEPSVTVQEGQESTAETSPPMTAKQLHEARLHAFREGDQQDRQAAKEEVAALTGGIDTSIEEVLGQAGLGVSGPHLGGGMTR